METSTKYTHTHIPTNRLNNEQWSGNSNLLLDTIALVLCFTFAFQFLFSNAISYETCFRAIDSSTEFSGINFLTQMLIKRGKILCEKLCALFFTFPHIQWNLVYPEGSSQGIRRMSKTPVNQTEITKLSSKNKRTNGI